jgi:16S rRNA (adenine1518-N6/adenine1519-N6)-dimethyltransferase
MAHPKQLLNRHGIVPKKSLGQNFLIEESILSRISALGELTSIDHVLEVGPGLGSLTRKLAIDSGTVVAVELDQRLAPILQEQLEGFGNVQLVYGDILEIKIAELFDTAYKVLANVPYYVTGAILRHLLTPSLKPSLMVLTVQKEVADRLTAVQGDMSVLAVSVQLHGTIKREFIIRSGSFWPRPEVDSAVVRFQLHEERLLRHDEQPAFMKLVRMGFSSKRKQLHNNLRAYEPDRDRLRDAFVYTGIDATRRAETLSVEEWLALFRYLS